MDISVILHQMVQLFIVIGIGYLLFKVKMIGVEFNRQATKLLVNCTMPATIMSSVLAQPAERDLSIVFKVFGISLVIYILLPVLAILVVKLIRIPKEQQGLYMFMTTFSNVGFMGFPVVGSIFGDTAVFYAAMLNIIFTIANFTYGVVQMNYGTVSSGEKLFKWKNLLSPGLIFSVLSVLVYVAGVTFPADVVSVIDTLGSLTTPMAMLLIGSTLATMDIRSVINEKRVYAFIPFGQIIVPVIVWGILRLFVRDTLILGVMTVLLLMPVANNSVLFATMFEKDEQLAAKTVFISTVFSIVTVPLMLYILT